MAPKPRRSFGYQAKLDVAIQLLSGAKGSCSVAPAQNASDSTCEILTVMRDDTDYSLHPDFVNLGLFCAHVCEALDRGLGGNASGELGGSMHDAIEQLTTTIAEIQGKVAEKGQQDFLSWFENSQNDDKRAIASWRQELVGVLLVFNTELNINTRVAVERYHRDVLAALGDAHPPTQVRIPSGESPPPAPKAFFGRDGLVDEIVSRAEKLEFIALIGAGGIGKTSLALTVLHDKRIKEQFGANRRFVSCDKPPVSRANFLARLSKVVGAGVETPEDLASLRPFLSSQQMLIILDNAESILDPQGTDARAIYAIVKELSDFNNICLGITSRISTVPPHCKRLEIPTLTMEAARDVFYSIYGDGERSSIIDDLLQRLDFHALSITLLATVASDNKWSYDRLAEEWGEHRSQVLKTDHNDSLAATIELSLTSPTFRKLGPNARDLLGVVAFYPQGVDEKNRKWFFPTIPDRQNIFDKFCVLSLAHRSNGFVTMLAPLRDYLSPQLPESSPCLCATRDCYFARLSVDLYPGRPGFAEAEWIKLESVNVEHLLDVFTSANTGAFNVWDPCAKFMEHLYWHKPRQTVLRSKIQGLPDSHPSKPLCLFELSQLLGSVGNYTEQKQLLIHALKLSREMEDYFRVAQILRSLAGVNLMLGLHKEGMQWAEEGLEMYERLGDMAGRARCLHNLAWLLLRDDQLTAAEDHALRPIDFLPKTGEEYLLCKSHRVLSVVYDAAGKTVDAIRHLEMALGIAAPFGWRSELFSVHYSLAKLFCTESEFDDANAHIELAKSHTVEDAYDLGLVMEMQAWIWYRQRRAEDARCEALRGLEVYEKLGAERDMGKCRNLLRQIEKSIETQIFPEEKGSQYIEIVNCSLPISGEDSPKTPLEDADGYFIAERNAVRSLFPKHVL